MKKLRLYDEFIRRLIEVNDETKTEEEHNRLDFMFSAWRDGVEDASGHRFNGDYYYIEKIDAREIEDRPMCSGVFLDWEHKVT